MDKSQFAAWFRTTSNKYDVGDTRLRWMNPGEYYYGELGNYNPNTQVVSIDGRTLSNDRIAINVGLHELAHAIAMKRDSDTFKRQGVQLVYRTDDPMARGKLLGIERTNGHDDTWFSIAKRIGVDISHYVDRKESSTTQLRRAIGLRL